MELFKLGGSILRMKIKKNYNSYNILKNVLLAGGVLTLSAIAPLGGAIFVKEMIKGYFRKKDFERKTFLRDLKRLQVRNLLDFIELPDGSLKIILSKAGKKKALTYKIDEIRLDKKRLWDGRWRLVIFDIPSTKKRLYEVLHLKLRELEFYTIQKSVFIVPYRCEDEIDFIATLLGVREHVLILNVASFEGDEKLRYYFRIGEFKGSD